MKTKVPEELSAPWKPYNISAKEWVCSVLIGGVYPPGGWSLFTHTHTHTVGAQGSAVKKGKHTRLWFVLLGFSKIFLFKVFVFFSNLV